ncbi:MAG: hypothetical protein KGI57_02180 [Hyphomicrobiales bacterium]|nr:hypothetical protein [Hyphomicrobiales bacterium]
MKRSAKFWSALAAVALTGGAGVAFAQSAPAPVGYWTTADGSETLFVDAGGTCKFEAWVGGAHSLIVGSCSWNPTSTGGVLTIMNVNQYKPAPIYESVVWVDRDTITVWGDVFKRRG